MPIIATFNAKAMHPPMELRSQMTVWPLPVDKILSLCNDQILTRIPELCVFLRFVPVACPFFNKFFSVQGSL